MGIKEAIEEIKEIPSHYGWENESYFCGEDVMKKKVLKILYSQENHTCATCRKYFLIDEETGSASCTLNPDPAPTKSTGYCDEWEAENSKSGQATK